MAFFSFFRIILAFTLSIFFLRLRSERYYLLLHLSIAVITAQVVFLLGIDAVHFKVNILYSGVLINKLQLFIQVFIEKKMYTRGDPELPGI